MASIPSTPEWAAAEVQAFLDRLELERNLSEHTVAAYRRDLAQFFDFCDRYGCAAITAVDRTTLRRFHANLLSRGYAVRSVARKASAVRSFYGAMQVRRSAVLDKYTTIWRPSTIYGISRETNPRPPCWPQSTSSVSS